MGRSHAGLSEARQGSCGGVRAEDRTPAVEGQGIVVDIDAEDLDGDGLREIVLDRTTSDPFYLGFYIQVLTGLGGREFADETDRRIVGGADPEHRWFDWLRLIDVNDDGHLDIFADDYDDHGVTWLNDGSGRLIKEGSEDPR